MKRLIIRLCDALLTWADQSDPRYPRIAELIEVRVGAYIDRRYTLDELERI